MRKTETIFAFYISILIIFIDGGVLGKVQIIAKEVRYNFPADLSKTLGFKEDTILNSKNVQKITHINTSVFCFQIAEDQKSRFVLLDCPLNQRISNSEDSDISENKCILIHVFPKKWTPKDIRPLDSIHHEGVECTLLKTTFPDEKDKRSYHKHSLFCMTSSSRKNNQFYDLKTEDFVLEKILKFGNQIQLLKLSPYKNKEVYNIDLFMLKGLLVKIPSVSSLKSTKMRKLKSFLDKAPEAILKPLQQWHKLTLV